MYLKTKPGILKTISVALLVVVTGLWINARNESAVKEYLDNPILYDICKLDEECPHEVKAVETAAVWLVIVCLVGMAIDLLASIFLDTKKSDMNSVDLGVTGVAAALVLIAGALMIYSAVRVDEYIIFVDVRDETKYTDKLVAGALAIIDAILLSATSAAIKKHRNPVSVVVIQQPAPMQQYPATHMQMPVQNQSTQQQQYAYPNQGYAQNPHPYTINATPISIPKANN